MSHGRREGRAARDLLLLAAFTLLLHLPFLSRPVQGDEPAYFEMAAHVLREPLAPLNFRTVYLGQEVDMAGHPHPPLNAYLLAVLWAVRGHISPLFSHASYLCFTLAISLAAYVLALRFTTRPLWTALLVASAPVVQVAGNTLESDAPALAFLLAGAALFLHRPGAEDSGRDSSLRFFGAAAALSLAGFAALQALVVAPILLLDYAARQERPPRAAWAAAAAPFLFWAAWQALQWTLTHRLPAAVLGGYALAYGGMKIKLASGAALLQHLGVLVVFLPVAWRRFRPPAVAFAFLGGSLAAALVHGYPWWERVMLAVFLSLGFYGLVWLWTMMGGAGVLAGHPDDRQQRRSPFGPGRAQDFFLAAWCLLYFGFALVAFFAGSARYLLPLAVPLVLLFVRQLEARPSRLGLALAMNILLGLNLSFADYEFARAYSGLRPPPGTASSFLVNGEWGFRYHLTRLGGRPVEQTSVARPGEWIVSSELSLAANHGSQAEAIAVPLESRDIRLRTPVRLIDRFAHSGYSSAAFGLLPFSFSSRPLDRITYARTSPFLYLDAPWTPTQFSGRLVYLPLAGASIPLPLEPGATRLHFALFAQGHGQASFLIRDPSGRRVFERGVQVRGEIWQPETLEIHGLPSVTLTIETYAAVRAGWGELVDF